MSENMVAGEIITLIGEEGLIRLAEEHGGIRLYVPKNSEQSQLCATVGSDITSRLTRRYAGDYIRVPLVRDLRARHYRELGLSNAQIARKLGLTEKGVERLFRRQPVEYRRPKVDDRQFEMFPTDY